MLPNASAAIIDPAKVRDYLLSHQHPVGRFKAIVFEALGYRSDDWARLHDDLIAIAHSQPARAVESGPFGQKFVIGATLKGPNGRTARITSVWLLANDSAAPRLITAYPE